MSDTNLGTPVDRLPDPMDLGNFSSSNQANCEDEFMFERITKAYGESMTMVDVIAELSLRLLRQSTLARMTNQPGTAL